MENGKTMYSSIEQTIKELKDAIIENVDYVKSPTQLTLIRNIYDIEKLPMTSQHSILYLKKQLESHQELSDLWKLLMIGGIVHVAKINQNSLSKFRNENLFLLGDYIASCENLEEQGRFAANNATLSLAISKAPNEEDKQFLLLHYLVNDMKSHARTMDPITRFFELQEEFMANPYSDLIRNIVPPIRMGRLRNKEDILSKDTEAALAM